MARAGNGPHLRINPLARCVESDSFNEEKEEKGEADRPFGF
jgi:hypothetical protein